MRTLAKQSMMKKSSGIIIAITAWFAILLQLYLTTGSVANFFSYFTILSNLLIAISLSVILFNRNSKSGLFFSTVSVQSAIALYIFIVCLVYNLVLRGLVMMAGWQLFVDTLLHVIIPILYLLYYLVFIPKGHLQWKDGLYWICFPVVYLIYSLIRGAFVHWYPYPFLNAEVLGYSKVFLNVIVMVIVFFVAGLVLIAINRSFKKQNNLS